MSAKCHKRKWTGSSIEFSRVGGVLIPRTVAHSTLRCIPSTGHMVHCDGRGHVRDRFGEPKERSCQRDWNNKSPKADIGGERYLKGRRALLAVVPNISRNNDI